jgi:hypothetical protein
MSASSSPETERGVSRRIVEIIVALLLVILAVLVLFDSYGRGAGWDGGPQNGFFPARVGWLLLGASAFVLVSAVRATDEVFVTWHQLRQVTRVFIPLLMFIVGIAFLGIYVSSALFVALFMVTLGSFRWWAVALASILVPLITFWVFEMQFRVPLPKGVVEAMIGY